MPLCLSIFLGKFSPMLVSVMIAMAANFSYATPACAIAQESGWLTSKQLLLYDLAAAALCAVIAFAVGVPLGHLLCT